MHIGIVCGFRAEQRIAGLISPLTACGWHNPVAAKSLIDAGAECLVSFGLAGALDPACRTGEIVIADRIVLSDGAAHHCDAALTDRLQAMFGQARRGAMFAGSDVIATPDAKRELFARTQAVATDMESAAVAATAVAHGIPFCVFRVIADRAGDTLPPAALAGLNPDGSTAFGPVLRSILHHPAQIPSLAKLGWSSRTALNILRRCAPQISAALAVK